MGTSTSSTGPRNNVPFEHTIKGSDKKKKTDELSPPRRFSNASTKLGQYVKTYGELNQQDNRALLRKALGNYSKKGMGGAALLSSRMKVSSRVGESLANTLLKMKNGDEKTLTQWVKELAEQKLTDAEFRDLLIKYINIEGGELDIISCQNSISYALSEVLEIEPDFSFQNLTEETIWSILELFLAHEAHTRITLDIGKIFESKKLSALRIVNIMDDILDFLHSEISLTVDTIIKKGSRRVVNVKETLKVVIEKTFKVFEEDL